VKRNPKRSKRRQETIQVWTYDQARRVLPYVTSIMRSLREAQLEAQQHGRTARRLAKQPGRPSRDQIIAQEEASRKAEAAKERFHEALEELHTLDVYCLDPLRGQALIPFAQEDQLAWYVFDLFAPEPMSFWRYHKDPLETRRPIAPERTPPSDSLII
jgi:hypothetical protein